MKKEMFQKVLQIMLPDSEIIEYNILPRNKLNENNEWVPDSPAVFVSIKYSDDNGSVSNGILSRQLTELTGYEVNIDVGLSIKIYNTKIKVDGKET
jgi:hypothetical protein